MLQPMNDPNVTTPAIKVGFTGTQHGMSPLQHRKLAAILRGLDVSEFHH